ETHTDARSDIYSYGATLYHLLTNEPPADARKRFVQPTSLIAPREINPSIKPRTERAVLWAMALHPDDRPATIQAFNEFLFEGRDVLPTRTTQSAFEIPRLDLFGEQTDTILAWTSAGLLLISLIATLVR
ncbi:MAG TPA: serine/threonine protein kinase, partial [Anaerolineales bacterium]|nr:serine/threonine protein kinase [Anaerolineales bacterium]